MSRFRARWVYPGSGPPIQDATINVEDGIISEIGSGESDAVDLGEVAILPGLVNAHTHLEFSLLDEPLQPLADFIPWIRSVINWRTENQAQLSFAVLQGIRESVESGTTSIGEIATTDWRQLPTELEKHFLPNIVMFREYLGLSADRVNSTLEDAEQFLNADSINHITAALSAHAPYSTHPDLYNRLDDLARKKKVPLAVHLAESPAEITLLHEGTGPFRDMLLKMNLWEPDVFPGNQRPLDRLRGTSSSGNWLVIHGNYLNEEELDFLAEQSNVSVIYCPRTHTTMQTNEHPWKQMICKGINVALGTDSRASNPDLSIWNELRFLKASHPDWKTSALLKLATANGAAALGFETRGRIAPGMVADLCVVKLSEAAIGNPEESLLTSQSVISGVMIRGHWVVGP